MQFLGGMMSHELRVPLNAMVTLPHLLDHEQFGTLTEGQRELQARIIANGEELAKLLDDLLTYARTHQPAMPDGHNAE